MAISEFFLCPMKLILPQNVKSPSKSKYIPIMNGYELHGAKNEDTKSKIRKLENKN